MEKLKQSPAELLKEVQIQSIEQEQLNRVFEFLTTRDTTKQDNTDKISAMDIARTLQFLGCKPTRAEVELIIWVSSRLKSMLHFETLILVDRPRANA